MFRNIMTARESGLLDGKEKLKEKYENFLQTEDGKEWQRQQRQNSPDREIGFNDYLHYFYPLVFLFG